MGFISKLKLRKWLRAIHRDAGYFVIGLTLVYAVSGIAVNHLADWDPNFEQVDRVVVLGEFDASGQLKPLGPEKFSRRLGERFQTQGPPIDIYEEEAGALEITFEETTLYVDLLKNEVRQEGQRPRFLLRVINWLHLNRGKAAWTYIADLYAAILLYLAISGYFMLPQKKRFLNRRELFVILGIALPVLYVLFSGGP